MKCPDQPHGKYDIGFILDASSSIKYDDWETEKSFVKKLAKVLRISSEEGRAAVTVFERYAKVMIKFSDHKSFHKFESAVDELQQTKGSTNIGNALEVALEKMFQTSNGMRKDSTKAVVLITDGQNNVNKYKYIDYGFLATKFRKANIKIIVIGIGRVNKKTLRKLVADKNDLYFTNNFEDLKINSFFRQVGNNLCATI